METLKLKKKKSFPHTLVIISAIIILAGILTYVIPAGEYVRVEDAATGRMVVDPSSFKQIESSPISLLGLFRSIPQGFIETAWICFLILIVGGAFHLVTTTGAIQAFLNKIISKSKGQSYKAIPLIVLLFSIIPTLMGTLEAYLAFVPLGVILARSMGLDAMVGLSIVVAGGGAGLASGVFNPYTVGTAQELIGLPVFSAWQYRLICYIGFNLSVSFWTVRYAKRILKDPTQSVCYELEQKVKEEEESVEMPELNLQNVAVLLVTLASIAYVVYTSLTGGDFKIEIPATFLIMMLIVSLIKRYSMNEMMKTFTIGAQNMVGGVMVVGFAKAIAVVLDQGNIIDTIVHALSSLMTGTNLIIAALIMFLIQYITNFFIISGAGQAAVTIPILSPIGDAVGLTQQTVVAAFQYGDGITNLLLPMSPLTSGSIAIAGLTYPQYFKFIWKIILTNTIIAAGAIVFAAAINLGPF